MENAIFISKYLFAYRKGKCANSEQQQQQQITNATERKTRPQDSAGRQEEEIKFFKKQAFLVHASLIIGGADN